MSNVLSEEKRHQIIALGRLGWPLRRIEQEAGVRRETASAYLKSAGIGVRPPRAWGRRPPAKPANEVITGSTAESPATNGKPNDLPEEGKAKPANEVITGFGVGLSDVASSKVSFCEPFREAIELGLSRGRNARAIWQDLVADQGFRAGYLSVQRFVRRLRGKQPAQARAVIFTAPGEEAQVDYGNKGPMVRDARTGKYRRTRLFVLTLGYSRKAVRLLTFQSSSRIWAELHEKAFRRLGGTLGAWARCVRPKTVRRPLRLFYSYGDTLTCSRAWRRLPRVRIRQKSVLLTACADNVSDCASARYNFGTIEARAERSFWLLSDTE